MNGFASQWNIGFIVSMFRSLPMKFYHNGFISNSMFSLLIHVNVVKLSSYQVTRKYQCNVLKCVVK